MPETGPGDLRPLMALLIFAAAVAALYLQPLSSITTRVPASYDEGWNAYNAAAAIGGGRLYPPPDALIADNYPPVSFYVVGEFGRVVGDNIIAGRLIALASLAIVAGNIFLVLRSLDARPLACGFASLVYLAYIGAFFYGYVAIDEPQWLGHALETGGLVIFLMSRGRHPGWLGLLAPALMAVAGLVKTNLMPLPLAILIWCAIYDRVELRRWLAIGVAVGGTIAIACYLRFDLHRMTALLKALPRRRAPGRPEPAVDRVKPLDPATSRRRHRERRAGAAAFWIFAVVVAALYLPLLWSIAARIPASYDEGWNAYNAEAAIGGGMLYPPRDALIADNYPPLSFYVVGGLGRLVGDDIIAGRLIAAASLLVVAGNVFLVLRALDAQPLDCGFGDLLFLAYTGTFFRGYVAIDEPQWLGHALETGGWSFS